MFKTRLLSGIVLLVLIFAFLWMGGDVLLCGLLALTIGGMFELYRVIKIEKSRLAIFSYFMAAVFFANLRFHFLEDDTWMLSMFFTLFLAIYVFSYPLFSVQEVAIAWFGFFYLAMMLSYIYKLRQLDQGIYLVWLVILCSWGCDTLAYCAGVLFGKHKMAPVLSPKKSIEGAIGGLLGAMLLVGLYSFVFREKMGMDTTKILMLSVVAGAAALLSMVGDLAASAIKRNYNIKDYGTLIPGHGGILDRFDSVIITAPVIYGLCYYFYG